MLLSSLFESNGPQLNWNYVSYAIDENQLDSNVNCQSICTDLFSRQEIQSASMTWILTSHSRDLNAHLLSCNVCSTNFVTQEVTNIYNWKLFSCDASDTTLKTCARAREGGRGWVKYIIWWLQLCSWFTLSGFPKYTMKNIAKVQVRANKIGALECERKKRV